jgi:hypothetical protein
VVAVIAACNVASGFTSPCVAASVGKYMKQPAYCDVFNFPVSFCSIRPRSLKGNTLVFISQTNNNVHHPAELNTQGRVGDSEGCIKPQRTSKVLRSLRTKLRKGCKSIASTSMVALLAWRIGGARPAHASVRSFTASSNSIVLVSTATSNVSPGIELLTKIPGLKKQNEVKHPTVTLEDFQRLRREVPSLPASSDNTGGTSTSVASVVTPELQHPFKVSAAAHNTAIELRNQARNKKYSNSALSPKLNRAAPFAGAAFLLLNLFRSKVRYDREKAYVEDNIEKLEIQKMEYFNVTGQSLSDDDLMASLASAAGNITLDGNDYNEDDEDDDDDEQDLKGNLKRPPPSSPKTPTGSGGSEPKKKSRSSDSSNDSGRSASDDEIERMKRMFKK